MTTGNEDPFIITKRDGSNFTTEEVRNLKFTINGAVVSASGESLFEWIVDSTTVMQVALTSWSNSIEISMMQSGYTISAIE